MRVSAVDDGIKSGITLEESMVTVRLAEKASINCIHCSMGAQTSDDRIPVSSSDKALGVKNAEAIKKAVSIPVITVGRITEATLAENAVLSGRADLVAMFRASLADPEFPNKLKDGRENEINYCIGCRQGCTGANRKLTEFSCLVRPLTGRAHMYDLATVEERKRIAVVGGGVSGSEAAIFAAMRGHKVTIFEQADRLGGRWIAASIPPGKADYASFLNYQSSMLEKYGVDVKLNTTVTAELMKEFAPDLILLANGADDFMPPIPGIDGENVVKAQDVLRSRCSVGKRAVVIGGGLVGAETADYAASCCGKKVSVIEMQSAICTDGEPGPTKVIMNSFKTHGVDVYTSASVNEITADCVKLVYEGVALEIPCDTVIMATGIKPSDRLYDELKVLDIPVVKTGDASSGKNGLENICESFRIGATI